MITIPVSKNKKINIYKSLIILVMISLQIIGMLYFVQEQSAKTVLCVLLSSLCLIEIYSDSKIKILFYTQIILSSFGIILAWFNVFQTLPKELIFIEYCFFALFYSVAVCSTIYKVSNCFKLNNDTIFNAINGYLYIGLLGSILATIIASTNSDAFKFANAIEQSQEIGQYVYYSYVTLTTVGYGDIVPNSNPSKLLSMFLSVSGSLYLSIIIGLIIGKYVSKLALSEHRRSN
jgi:voltage-gated potassium channel